MVVQKNCNFITEATIPTKSKPFPNTSGDVLSLQIIGANGLYYVEGRVSSRAPWVSLAGINLSDFSAVRNGFTKAGIYEIGIVGIRELRVRTESLEGTVSIFGQIISAEEA